MTNECEDCDSIICSERGCAAPVNKENKMIDWSKPLETVCGNPVELLKDDYRQDGYTYCLVFQRGYDSLIGDAAYLVDKEGFRNGSQLIRNRKVKREGWVNIYKDRFTSYWRDTKAEALARVFPEDENYIATVKIEWEE